MTRQKVSLASPSRLPPDGPVRGNLVQHHAGAPEALRQVRRADPEGQRDVHDPAAHPDGHRPDGAADGAPQQHAAGERAPGALQHEARRGLCQQQVVAAAGPSGPRGSAGLSSCGGGGGACKDVCFVFREVSMCEHVTLYLPLHILLNTHTCTRTHTHT